MKQAATEKISLAINPENADEQHHYYSQLRPYFFKLIHQDNQWYFKLV
jgi:hypothetical protein